MNWGLDLNHPFRILEFKEEATVLVVIYEPIRVEVVPAITSILRNRMPVHIASVVVSAHAWVPIDEIEVAWRLGGRDAVRALLGRKQ